MPYELGLYRRRLRETIIDTIKQLLFTCLSLTATIGSYFYLDSPEREVLMVIASISTIIGVSYVPHLFSKVARLRILIRNSTHTWVIRDKRGHNIASYPSLEAMKKDNPGVFKPQANRERYTIINTKTGKIGGVIIYEEHYQWKPHHEVENEN